MIDWVNGNGTYNVLYDDNDKELNVLPEKLRPLGGAPAAAGAGAYAEGAKVECRFKNTDSYYPATITTARRRRRARPAHLCAAPEQGWLCRSTHIRPSPRWLLAQRSHRLLLGGPRRAMT